MEGLVLSVYQFYYWVDDGNEYLFALFVDLEKGLCGVFDDALQGADVAVLAIDNAETDNFVEIELVAGELGQQVKGQVQVVSGQGMGFVGSKILKGDDGLVAVDIVHFEKVGDKTGLGFYEDRVEVGVVLRAVHVEIEDHLSFVSERLGDVA